VGKGITKSNGTDNQAEVNKRIPAQLQEL